MSRVLVRGSVHIMSLSGGIASKLNLSTDILS